MNEANTILNLQKENEELKKENEMLLSIIAQMKMTLNRLINQYMTNTENKEPA